MKGFVLLLLAAFLAVAAVFFFHRSGELLAGKDYLAGLLHIFVGLATIRHAVELARLAVLPKLRS